MLHVTVIGGYLGAGKTTLVNNMLRHADGVKLAVLVNEFGDLPIDADLIEAQDDTIISIAGGCVCCSYGNDLIRVMMELAERDPTPDHILLEASGVALPGAIASSISLLSDFQIDGIVVVADADTIEMQSNDPYIGDTIERQLVDANIVVLNKSDLISPEQRADNEKLIAQVSPHTSVIHAQHGQVPNAVIMQPHGLDAASLAHKKDDHSGLFESHHVTVEGIVNADAVARALADPAMRIIRAKGFVTTTKGLRTVQTVSRQWSTCDAPSGAKPGLVVIGFKGRLDLEQVRSVFAATDGATKQP